MIGVKPLRIRFDKVDRFIRVCNGTRYLVLFGSEKYDAICNRIRFLTGVKSSITFVISHYFAKIKVDPYDFLPLEKKLTVHVITLVKSVWNKYNNNYY